MKRRFLSLLLSVCLVSALLPAARAQEESGETPGLTALCVARPGESVLLDLEEFQLLCRQATRHELESVTFSPLSPRVGTLTCGKDKVTAGEAYSLHEHPLLSQVRFTPYSYRSSQFTGQAEISFTMTDEKEETVSGTLVFYVPEEPAYILPQSRFSPVDVETLDALCRQKTDSPLRQLSFREPYIPYLSYDRGEGEPSYITKRMVFYAHPSSRDERDLGKVSLRALSLPYIYLTVDGKSVDNQNFSARIRVDMPQREGGYGSLIEGDTPIFLMDHLPFYKNLDDEFVCPGRDGKLTSISFSLPPTSQGSLWLDYGDRDGRKLLPEETFHPDDGFNPYRLSFVPAKEGAGQVCLDYTFSSANGGRQEDSLFFRLPAQTPSSPPAKDPAAPSGREPSPPSKSPSPATVSTCTAQTGLAAALYQACAFRELGELKTVTFDTLPAAQEGLILSVDVPVTAGTAYPYSTLSFLPGDSFQGDITLRYVGLDSRDLPFSGDLTLSLDYPAEGRFQDLTGWEWAAYAVQFLDMQKAVPYSRSAPLFRPGETATRMELVYALVRIAYPDTERVTAPGFSDFPADGDLANAAAVAIAHGLLRGDGERRLLLDSQVTRQDALVMIHRALTDLGRDLPPAGDSLPLAVLFQKFLPLFLSAAFPVSPNNPVYP